ncbi:MAG: acetylxylan esterase [Clostridia bacterium]|nr:acetylxylan esterase [Clostridia bacterium]
MKTKFGRYLVLAVFALLLFALLAVSAGAATNVVPKPKNNAEKKLLTAEDFAHDCSEVPFGISAFYTVNKDALATLEEEYYVSFGVLVARCENGYTKNNLDMVKEGGRFVALDFAKMITVYSTEGHQPVNGRFDDEARETFTVTVDLEEKTVERCESQIVFRAFIILEDKAEEEEPRILYVTYAGSDYGNHPSYESFFRTPYTNDTGDSDKMNAYIAFLQDEMKHTVASLQNAPVFICGEDSAASLAEGEKAIWVEYLPEYAPYTAGDADKKAVRAAYLYYRLDFDPSQLSESMLAEKGVVRTFVYIGMPQGKASLPGMVCVHGGGGHAYAEYALEAVRNGFASIAIDTEGYYNFSQSGSYSAADNRYQKDALGHIGKDSFANAEGKLSEQWLYYAVCDTVIANTVLRSFGTVDEDSVGVTGISWGGLITSTTICYDMRFAFCAPVYISFHLTDSVGLSLADLPNMPFAAGLWQDASLLAASTVPTMIIAGETDSFASVNTLSASASDLPKGFLTVKPGLSHGQQQGASLPEVYYFAYSVLGQNGGFIKAKEQPTAAWGKSFTLSLSIPENFENVTATLYYRTSPLPTYDSVEANKPKFTAEALTVNPDGTVAVTLPADTSLYFISFCGYDEGVAAKKNKGNMPYQYGDTFPKGNIYSSTDAVFFD